MYDDELDLKKAEEAYDKGDYATALRLFRTLAELGDANAQFRLGYMYHKGEGVPRNYQEAFEQYRLAAKQRHTEALYEIGNLKSIGRDLEEQDAVRIHACWSLAAEQGHEKAAEARDELETRMPHDWIIKAQKIAQYWRDKGPLCEPSRNHTGPVRSPFGNMIR